MDYCGNCGCSFGGTEQKPLRTRTERVKTYVPDPSYEDRGLFLTWIVGPALTLAAFALIIGQVWARALLEMPQDRSSGTYLNDLKTAGDLSFAGIVAFAILVVFAVYLLAHERH
jgi:hypothetical protein